MTNLLAARLQMAFFLGFQMIFAQISAALPVVVAVTEWRWLQTGDAVCLDLAKRWASSWDEKARPR